MLIRRSNQTHKRGLEEMQKKKNDLPVNTTFNTQTFFLGIYKKVVPRLGREQKMAFHFSTASGALEFPKINPGALKPCLLGQKPWSSGP